MNPNRLSPFLAKGSVNPEVEDASAWDHWHCRLSGSGEIKEIRTGSSPSGIHRVRKKYSDDWEKSVPDLLGQVYAFWTEKKKQEIKFNLLQVTIDGLDKRVQRIESSQTVIVPVDSFAPEPYKVLKTILVTVNAVAGGFNAGWFDANIHFSGDNEQEAVSNLKGLILDFFDSFLAEPPEKLGPEPTRQLTVMKEFIFKVT